MNSKREKRSTTSLSTAQSNSATLAAFEMSQETVQFSPAAWRAVGAAVAAQGLQGQASPAQGEAPAAPVPSAADAADSFLNSLLQEAACSTTLEDRRKLF